MKFSTLATAGALAITSMAAPTTEETSSPFDTNIIPVPDSNDPNHKTMVQTPSHVIARDTLHDHKSQVLTVDCTNLSRPVLLNNESVPQSSIAGEKRIIYIPSKNMIVDCRSENIPVVYANGMRVGLKATGFELEGMYPGNQDVVHKRGEGYYGSESEGGEATVQMMLMTLAKAMLGGKAGPATVEEEQLAEGLKRQMRKDIAMALDMKKRGLEVEKRGEGGVIDMHDVLVMTAKSMLHGKAKGEVTDAEAAIVDALEKDMLAKIEAEMEEEERLNGEQ